MELTTIQQDEQKQNLGRRFIPADACSYPPAVMPDDVLLVDFDQDVVTVEGLYLLERVQGGAVVWMGCRRFDISITRGILVDGNGRGDMEPFHSATGMRIAGRVLRVYRPTDKLGHMQ